VLLPSRLRPTSPASEPDCELLAEAEYRIVSPGRLDPGERKIGPLRELLAN
jgi:hypothetical protein